VPAARRARACRHCRAQQSGRSSSASALAPVHGEIMAPRHHRRGDRKSLRHSAGEKAATIGNHLSFSVNTSLGFPRRLCIHRMTRRHPHIASARQLRAIRSILQESNLASHPIRSCMPHSFLLRSREQNGAQRHRSVFACSCPWTIPMPRAQDRPTGIVPRRFQDLRSGEEPQAAIHPRARSAGPRIVHRRFLVALGMQLCPPTLFR
jgi:hypothetical protein